VNSQDPKNVLQQHKKSNFWTRKNEARYKQKNDYQCNEKKEESCEEDHHHHTHPHNKNKKKNQLMNNITSNKTMNMFNSITYFACISMLA
jgi:hypothetical protein